MSKKILVVDDEKLVRDFNCALLQRIGFSVETAKNGKEALEKLVSDGHFTGIVTDIDMPEMSGIQLVQELNRNGRKYPIILMSGDPCNKPLVNIIKYSGNWRYLDKPVDIHRFYEKAEELFGKAEE